MGTREEREKNQRNRVSGIGAGDSIIDDVVLEASIVAVKMHDLMDHSTPKGKIIGLMALVSVIKYEVQTSDGMFTEENFISQVSRMTRAICDEIRRNG
jgi:hypothetical protein